MGNSSNVDITLADINTKLNDIISGIPDIIQKTSLIKIPHTQIKNIVYTVASGSGEWSKQNNSIKYTAEVAGVYRFSVFGGVDFRISTRYLARHSTDIFSGTVSVTINKGTEEEFILDPADKTITGANYWWCLEFVAERTLLPIT